MSKGRGTIKQRQVRLAEQESVTPYIPSVHKVIFLYIKVSHFSGTILLS